MYITINNIIVEITINVLIIFVYLYNVKYLLKTKAIIDIMTFIFVFYLNIKHIIFFR